MATLDVPPPAPVGGALPTPAAGAPSRPGPIHGRCAPSLAAVPAPEWDALVGCGNGPLQHGFLRAWEQHRDVPAAAWVRRNGTPGEDQPGTLVVVRDFLDR